MSWRTASLAFLALPALVLAPSAAQGSGPDPDPAATGALFAQISGEYTSAFRSHDPVAAARVRELAAAAGTLAVESRQGPASRVAGRLERELAATTFTLRIWPLPDQIRAMAIALSRDLIGDGVAAGVGTAANARALTGSLVAAATTSKAARRTAAAQADLAQAYAVFANSVAPPLDAIAPELTAKTENDLSSALRAVGQPGSPAMTQRQRSQLNEDLHQDAAALGEVTVSRGTIVTDAAIILFREGLEAVLILAAITASFTGERRRLRRPVFIGALAGLAATAVTYVLAQAIVDALGDGGLRLQAITGLLAIAVLLVVTNWFFHRVYWSEWIARFNRRRKALERVERLGFISGQTLGFVILGLTSVYREGFETVLFLQNLQVSAGTSATLFGVAIGLVATLIVGLITFVLGRRLPYRRMLIVTGVLIGLVLAVMVGTTINNLQGLGWMPNNQLGFTVDPRLSQWTGFYPTWEGLCAQTAALLVVYGSYVVARQLQHRRRRHARTAPALAPD